MPKTLLAVDDSVTMRKVLEITFSGEDFNVVTADGRDAALAKAGENPDVVLVDTVLGSDDGYAVAAEVRRKAPNATMILLASRYAPYDAAKGSAAGADDFADKPFDTQQMIDKVKKAMATRASGGAPVMAAAPAAPPPAAPAPMAAAPAAPPPAAAPPAAVPQSQPRMPAGAPARSAGMRQPTLVFGGEAPAKLGEAPAPPKPAPAAPKLATPGAPPVAAAPPAAAAHVGAQVNGHLQGKLSELGLSPQQADAVLALSREVVERVVWEVVPQLAEAIIKEEIARLTKD